MVVLARLPPIPKHPDGVGVLRIVGDHGAALAIGAQVLTGVEAETTQVAHTAGPPALVLGAMGLGGILDHHQVAPAGDLQNRIHVGRLAIEMHRNNGFRFGRDGGFDLRGVDGVRRGVDVHENRRGPGVTDGRDRGYEGEGRGDDFVSRPHARR